MDNTEEQWKQIVIDGVTYDYEVSNTGKVRSLNYGRTGQVKTLKQAESRNGYLFVILCKNGKQKRYYIHRLVAIAFIPNPHNLTQVNHKDENKHNNHVDNLEWITQRNNLKYGTRTERSTKARSKRVRCIETGVIYDSTHEASRQTGLSQGNIWSCCKGKLKTCGKLHWEYVDDTEEESENLIYYYYKPLTLVA